MEKQACLTQLLVGVVTLLLVVSTGVYVSTTVVSNGTTLRAAARE